MNNSFVINDILYFQLCNFGIISSQVQMTARFNPIIRLSLQITVFIISACLFLLLDFYFIGLTYIIVYVGAIAILFLFVIMMAETKLTPSPKTSQWQVSSYTLRPNNKDFISSSSFSSTTTNKKGWKENFNITNLFIGKGLILFIIQSFAIGKGYINLNSFTNIQGKNNKDYFSTISYFFYPSYQSEFITFTDIQTLGFTLYLAYPFATLMLGVLLLCVLLGTLMVASL